MKPTTWINIDTFGLVSSFYLCFVGFLLMLFDFMNYNYLPHGWSNRLGSSTLWTWGLLSFVTGIIFFIILESGGKFNQGTKRVRFKFAFLIMTFLMASIVLMYYSAATFTI